MTRAGRSSIFSGLVYCADCGSKMLYGSSNNGDLDQDFFVCSLHRKDKEKCNGYFIRVKVLERLVLKHIQAVMGCILRHDLDRMSYTMKYSAYQDMAPFSRNDRIQWLNLLKNAPHFVRLL